MPGRSGFDEAQRRRVSIASCFDRELVVVIGIVTSGVNGKASCGAVLKTLVNWQDHQLPCPGQVPVSKEARNIGLGARIIALVPAHNLAHAVGKVSCSSLTDDCGCGF